MVCVCVHTYSARDNRHFSYCLIGTQRDSVTRTGGGHNMSYALVIYSFLNMTASQPLLTGSDNRPAGTGNRKRVLV